MLVALGLTLVAVAVEVAALARLVETHRDQQVALVAAVPPMFFLDHPLLMAAAVEAAVPLVGLVALVAAEPEGQPVGQAGQPTREAEVVDAPTPTLVVTVVPASSSSATRSDNHPERNK